MNWPQADSDIVSTLGLVALYDFTERERRRLVERTEAADRVSTPPQRYGGNSHDHSLPLRSRHPRVRPC